jgi:Cystatin domain
MRNKLLKFILISIIFSMALACSASEHITGGISSAEKEDETEINELLKAHLNRLETGDSGTFVLISKEKMTKQVVAGMSYTITGTFKAGNKEVEQCTVTIWHRPWLTDIDEKVKIKAECVSQTYKAKNELMEW